MSGAAGQPHSLPLARHTLGRGWLAATQQSLPLALYTLALLSPNLVLLLIAPTAANMAKLALCIGFFLAWHLAFNEFAHAVAASLPFFLLLPFDLFFVITYGYPPGAGVFAIILDTNPGEVADYLQGRVPLAAGAVAAFLAVWAYACSTAFSLGRQRAVRATPKGAGA